MNRILLLLAITACNTPTPLPVAPVEPTVEASVEVPVAEPPVVTPPVEPATPTTHSPSRIQCNDGTLSPSCSACTRGCCSNHGGCK